MPLISGQELRMRMTQQGLSQSQLVKDTGLDKNTVSHACKTGMDGNHVIASTAK